MKTLVLLDDFVLHKLTNFTCDTVEKQKACMTSSLKKSHKITVRRHLSRMEVLNAYIGIMPTLMDSASSVASTEKGNTPFNEATLAGIFVVTCPLAWRNQYNLTHRTAPKSPSAMLTDLENTEKIFVERYNDKARTNKAKASTAN